MSELRNPCAEIVFDSMICQWLHIPTVLASQCGRLAEPYGLLCTEHRHAMGIIRTHWRSWG